MDQNTAQKNFGALIKAARVKAGMTQRSLGAELGFRSGQFIMAIEKGNRLIPPRHVPHLARVLAIEQDELVKRLLEIHVLRPRQNGPAR